MHEQHGDEIFPAPIGMGDLHSHIQHHAIVIRHGVDGPVFDINAKVYIEVLSTEDQQPVESPARLRTQWINAQAKHGLGLCQSLLHRPLPTGPGYIWIGGESAAIRRLKQHYLQERDIPRRCLSAKGYWKAGEADHRDA